MGGGGKMHENRAKRERREGLEGRLGREKIYGFYAVEKIWWYGGGISEVSWRFDKDCINMQDERWEMRDKRQGMRDKG